MPKKETPPTSEAIQNLEARLAAARERTDLLAREEKLTRELHDLAAEIREAEMALSPLIETRTTARLEKSERLPLRRRLAKVAVTAISEDRALTAAEAADIVLGLALKEFQIEVGELTGKQTDSQRKIISDLKTRRAALETELEQVRDAIVAE